MLRYHNWGKELVQRGDTVTIIAASTIHNTDLTLLKNLGKQKTVATAYCIGILERQSIAATGCSE